MMERKRVSVIVVGLLLVCLFMSNVRAGLWETELWLKKIWPKHRVIHMTWCCDAVLVWEDQVIYARIKNTGTEGIYVRVWMAFTDETGYTEDWDPYQDTPLTTESAYIGPRKSVVVSMKVGCIDPLWCVILPPTLAYESGVFQVHGQLQVSEDGVIWYNWGDFDPPLPGDGFSRPCKFKVYGP